MDFLLILHGFWLDFWMHLGLFLDGFWMDFAWILDELLHGFGWFRMDLGWILDGLGQILDRCLMGFG